MLHAVCYTWLAGSLSHESQTCRIEAGVFFQQEIGAADKSLKSTRFPNGVVSSSPPPPHLHPVYNLSPCSFKMGLAGQVLGHVSLPAIVLGLVASLVIYSVYKTTEENRRLDKLGAHAPRLTARLPLSETFCPMLASCPVPRSNCRRL